MKTLKYKGLELPIGMDIDEEISVEQKTSLCWKMNGDRFTNLRSGCNNVFSCEQCLLSESHPHNIALFVEFSKSSTKARYAEILL